jgi:hypothetical protein
MRKVVGSRAGPAACERGAGLDHRDGLMFSMTLPGTIKMYSFRRADRAHFPPFQKPLWIPPSNAARNALLSRPRG